MKKSPEVSPISRAQSQVLDAKMAVLTVPAAQRLLDGVVERIAGNLHDTAEPHGSYVARNLSFLVGRLDRIKKNAAFTQSVMPDEEAPMVNMGGLMYGAKADMRGEFGDPEHMEVPSSLNPQLHGGLEPAYFAREAGRIVELRFGETYADQRNT